MTSIAQYFKNIIYGKEEKVPQNCVNFSETNLLAEDCMTPRSEMSFIEITDSHEEIMESIANNQNKFIVVYEDNTDNIVGVMNIFEYIKQKQIDKTKLKKPNFITVHENLKSFYNKVVENDTLQIVVNEFGDTKGMITSESILKNMFEVSKQLYFNNSGEIIVSGKVNLKYFSSLINLQFDGEKFQSKTLSGFLLESIGYLPKKDEKITIGNFCFEILELKDRYIKKIKVSTISAALV